MSYRPRRSKAALLSGTDHLSWGHSQGNNTKTRAGGRPYRNRGRHSAKHHHHTAHTPHRTSKQRARPQDEQYTPNHRAQPKPPAPHRTTRARGGGRESGRPPRGGGSHQASPAAASPGRGGGTRGEGENTTKKRAAGTREASPRRERPGGPRGSRAQAPPLPDRQTGPRDREKAIGARQEGGVLLPLSLSALYPCPLRNASSPKSD